MVIGGVSAENAADRIWGMVAQSPAWRGAESFAAPLMEPVPMGATSGYGPSLGSSKPSGPKKDQSAKYKGVAKMVRAAILKEALAASARQTAPNR